MIDDIDSVMVVGAGRMGQVSRSSTRLTNAA
jgi:hypothetical protein